MTPLLTNGGAAAVVMLRTVPDPGAFARVGPPAGEAPQAPGCRTTAVQNIYTGEHRPFKTIPA